MVPGAVSPRSWARLGFLIVMTAIIQVGIINNIVVGGAHGDVFLLLAVAAGLVAGPQHGAVIAFVSGLVADLFVLTPFGLSALCFVLVAFGVGQLAALPGGRTQNGFRLLVAAAAGVVGTLLFAVIGTMLNQPSIGFHQVAIVCVVVAVVNAVLVIPAVKAMSWVVKPSATQHELAAFSGGSAAK